MIWVKISGAPGNVTLNPIPIQLGKGYVCRARYQNGRMLPQDHAKGTDSWWMVNPSSGLGVLQDPSDEGEGERERAQGRQVMTPTLAQTFSVASGSPAPTHEAGSQDAHKDCHAQEADSTHNTSQYRLGQESW